MKDEARTGCDHTRFPLASKTRSVKGLELEACGLKLILVVPDEGLGSQVSDRAGARVGLVFGSATATLPSESVLMR